MIIIKIAGHPDRLSSFLFSKLSFLTLTSPISFFSRELRMEKLSERRFYVVRPLDAEV